MPPTPVLTHLRTIKVTFVDSFNRCHAVSNLPRIVSDICLNSPHLQQASFGWGLTVLGEYRLLDKLNMMLPGGLSQLDRLECLDWRCSETVRFYEACDDSSFKSLKCLALLEQEWSEAECRPEVGGATSGDRQLTSSSRQFLYRSSRRYSR